MTVVMLALSLFFAALWLNSLGRRLDANSKKIVSLAQQNRSLGEQNRQLNETSTQTLNLIKDALAKGPAQQKAFFNELTRRIQAAIDAARFSIESQQQSNGTTRTIVRVIPAPSVCTGPPGRCK